MTVPSSPNAYCANGSAAETPDISNGCYSGATASGAGCSFGGRPSTEACTLGTSPANFGCFVGYQASPNCSSGTAPNIACATGSTIS